LALSLVASGLKFVSLNFFPMAICLIVSASILDGKLSSIRAPFIGLISSAVSKMTSLFDVNSASTMTCSSGVNSSSANFSLAKLVERSVRIVGSSVPSVGSSFIVRSSDRSSDCVGISDDSSLAVGLSDDAKIFVGESVGR